jgi:hypothetical protein
MYSIEGRAIPSMIDGFKPSQLKSNTYLVRYGKQVMRGSKNISTSGKVASDAFIITVTPHWRCYNNNGTEI